MYDEFGNTPLAKKSRSDYFTQRLKKGVNSMASQITIINSARGASEEQHQGHDQALLCPMLLLCLLQNHNIYI